MLDPSLGTANLVLNTDSTCRMLPGLNAAAVGLIVAAVFSLTFQIYKASPFPTTTICIGADRIPLHCLCHAGCIDNLAACVALVHLRSVSAEL